MPNESLGQLTAQLGADIRQMRQSMDRAENMIRDYERTTDRRLDKAENRWRVYGRRVRGYASGMRNSIMSLQTAMAGMAGALIIGDTIRKAAQYEQTMAEVKGITQATQREFKALSEISREMGETTEWSASQAGEGLKFLSMAGFEAQQSVEALPGVLDLATAGNIELGRAADIASNALTAMRLPVRDLSRVNDTFVKTITTSNTNMEMLAESFKYAGSVGAAFGYEVEEISAMIGQLGNAGIQGSMAGTQLAMAFQKADDVFKKYNKRGVDTTEYTRDLAGAIELLEDQGADAAEVMDMFGQRAGRGVAALMGIGSDAIREYTGRIQDAEGATGELARTMRNTTIGRFRELKSVIESVQIDMFRRQSGSLNETLEDMAGYIRDNKDAIIDFADSAVEAMKGFAPLAKAAGSFIKDSMDAWNEAPETVQTLGIIGALMFGKKGLAALAGVSWMGKNLGKMIAEDLYGEIDVEERLTSQLKSLGNEAESIQRKILDLERLRAGETAGHFGSKQKEALENYREELSRVQQQIEQTYSTLEYMQGAQERKQKDAWTTEFAEKYKQSIGEVPAGIGRTVDELKKMHERQEEGTKTAQKQEKVFEDVSRALEDQLKQLRMTEREWTKYQTVQKLGGDATEEQKRQVRELTDRIYDLRRAMEWDEETTAPIGIGQMRGREGEDDTWAKDLLKEHEKASDDVQGVWEDLSGTMKDIFEGWGNRFSRQLNDMVWDAEFSADKIIEAFGRMATQVLIQKSIVEPFVGGITSQFSESAKGNVFSNGRHLQKYAQGGIVDRPTVFPMANGAGLMGEAGPEAVMPLTRVNGDLGVRAEGGSPSVEVNVYNNNNSNVEVQESQDGKSIDVIIDEAVASKVNQRGSATNKALRTGQNTRPQMIRR